MKNTIVALAGLLASVAATDIGYAIVVNECSYDVQLENTPSSGGGYSTVSQTLESGSTSNSYSQQWTELTNGNGWSMKLWPLDSSSGNVADIVPDNIMQYEYTYGAPTIWYDLSDVNGNPWNGNWEINGDGDCVPKQHAYMYATDDAYGEQSCSINSTITVTLCSGGDSSSASSVSSSAASTTAAASTYAASTYAASTSAVATSEASSSSAPATSSAPAASSSSPSPSHHNTWNGGAAKEDIATTSSAASVAPATTFATSVLTTASAVEGGDVVTVTEITTAEVTQYVYPSKRSEHVHQHQNMAARHPHARV